MGDKNQSHVCCVSNRDESGYGGSPQDPNPRIRPRKMNKQEDQDKDQTLELEPDRISELPDSLLIHILSLLPSLDQVIRTGTLSTRWLHLWTFVPNLVFPLPSSNITAEKFVSDVSKTLGQFRVSKVEKLAIHFPRSTPFFSDFDSWVDFATRNNVRDLSLGFGYDVFFLPEHLFTISSLKILKLEGCIVQPEGLTNWNALKSLSFDYARMSDGTMERILSGCPVLEILEVRNQIGINRLKVTSSSLRELVLSNWDTYFDEDFDDSYLAISAPNLRMLTISSCFCTWNICLEDVRSLVVADLSFYVDIDIFDLDIYPMDSVEHYNKYCNLLHELIEKLHHVEKLKLATWFVQVLSVLLEVKELTFPLLNCKHLTLDMHIAYDDLPAIAKLLDISPYLETFVISAETVCLKEFYVGNVLRAFDGENYILLQRKMIPEDALLRLKNVIIYGFRRANREVALVQFLLKNAILLENMNIYLQRDDFECQSTCCVWQEIVIEELNLPALGHVVVRLFESPEQFVEVLKLMLTRVQCQPRYLGCPSLTSI